MHADERRLSARQFSYFSICVYLCSSAVSLLFCGCQDFGTGGTGEMVVPQQTLRRIDPLDERGLATTRATTEPSTRPVAAHAVEVPLTLERVRQLTLQNNLDLKVDLLTPTIAKQNLSAEEARFEWVFVTDASFAALDQPTSSQLSGSQVRDLQVNPGVNIPLRTGGTLSFNVPMERFETNNQFSTLNPSYTS